MAVKKKTFEDSLSRLGEIVRTLERGDAPLADSLKLFEEGATLITACTKQLDEAEQKVVKLRKGPDGEPEEPGMLALAQDFESSRGLILSRLEAAGIPAFYRYPECGGLGKVVLGFSGYGVYIYVPKSRYEEAEEMVGGLAAPGRGY